MQSKQREISPLLLCFYFFVIKIFVYSWDLLELMSGTSLMLNVSNPLVAQHGALLIRLLNGSPVKSGVVSVCTSFPASARKAVYRKEQAPR